MNDQVHSNMYMNIILLRGYCKVVHALTKGRQQNKMYSSSSKTMQSLNGPYEEMQILLCTVTELMEIKVPNLPSSLGNKQKAKIIHVYTVIFNSLSLL